MKGFLYIFLVISLVGCANNKIEEANDLEEDGFDVESTADFLVEGEEELEAELSFDTPKEEATIEDIIDEPLNSASIPAQIASDLERYNVEENDTLMLVAFKLYGDYRKWRDLLEWNSELDGANLDGVSEIRYKKTNSKFSWKPKGNSYLIKRGNTLGTISSDVYGVSKRWREIYSNNREMIRDPNLIFIGFTLYYIPDRSLASE